MKVMRKVQTEKDSKWQKKLWLAPICHHLPFNKACEPNEH